MRTVGPAPAQLPPPGDSLNIELLLSASLLKGCSRSQIARLLNQAERRYLKPGETLFAAGEKAERVYVIEQGALVLHRPDLTTDVRQGALIGLEGMVGHEAYQDSALAARECSLLAIPAEDFEAFAQENPGILKRLLHDFQGHYREMATSIFHGFSRAGIARMLAKAEPRRLAAGAVIYTKGEAADRVFLVKEGAVKLRQSGEILGVRRASVLGLEKAVGHDQYLDTATAAQETSLIEIPVANLAALTKDSPGLLKRFFRAHEGRYQDWAPLEEEPGAVKAGKGEDRFGAEMTGWILTLLIPLLLYVLAPATGLGANLLFLIGIICVSVVMWVFDLVPAFVPALFSILMIILLEVAPPKVALAGFSSNTFIMCLSVFGISAMMIKSGLAYRLSLYLLRMMPPGRIWYGFALFLVGLVLTPMVPSKNGRVAIVQPFLVEMLNLADRSPRNDTATQYAMSATLGANLLSPIFLTGGSLNLMMFGLFDEQTRFTFNWLYWLLAASIPGLILGLGYVLLMLLAFRNGKPVALSRERLGEQAKVLGPMSSQEIGTLVMVVAMLILIPTVKFHKIEVPWLMLTVSVVLLMFGAIGKNEIKSGVDWPILLFIGSLLAWPGVIESSGLEALIVDMLKPVGWYMKNQFLLFIVLLSLAMVGLRLFLPINVGVVIFVTILLPVAHETGTSPWVVGFTILMMAEASVFAYQDVQRVQMESGLSQHGLTTALNEAKTNWLYLLLTLLRLVAILVSIPVWHYLNII